VAMKTHKCWCKGKCEIVYECLGVYELNKTLVV
jgi:hypothetical protein